MKKTIKLISMILSVVILISSFSISASAGAVPKRYKYKGFVYSFCGKNKVSIGGYVGNKKKITIPTKIKKYKVVKLDLYGRPGTFKGVEQIHYPNRFNIGSLGLAKQLKKVTVNKSNPKYSTKNNLLLNKKGTRVESCPGGLKSVKIPDSVKTIGVTSFHNGNLTKVEFGKKVKMVDLSAFNSCLKLKVIKFNSGLKEIEYDAFDNCKALETVELPEGFETLGIEAFIRCSNLKKVVIPSSTKLIDNGAFEKCNKLKKVYIYSKDCEIDPGEYDDYYKEYLSETIPKSATIYGYEGSTAQKYANKHGNKFVAL